jgi:predicted MFS family arabinose efflux permease
MSPSSIAAHPSSRQPHGPGTFRALRHRNYRLWFIGQGISLVGTWMQTMAQQVLVYRLTGSATSLGIISFIGLIPLIPLSLWSGSISDRFSKRTIIMAMQWTMLIQALLLSFLTWTGHIQVWHIYVLAFFLGAANAIDLPARQAFTVEMVEGKEDLTNAIGLNSAMFNGARALGPAMAGLVVAATGEGMAFLINAFTFVAVIISLSMMRNLPKPRILEKKVSLVKHTAEGFRFIFTQQAILILMSLIAVSAFLSMPYSTLMPVFAGDVLKNSATPVVQAVCGGAIPFIHCQSPEALLLGILLTMVGIGAVIGALVVASLDDRSTRGILLTAGNLVFPLCLIAFSASSSFLFSTFLLMLIGASFVMQNALANTLLQIITPDEVRGRVMSVYTLTFQTSNRLGGLQAGLMADRFGAPLTVGIGAVISLIFGLFVAIRYPKLRKL